MLKFGATRVALFLLAVLIVACQTETLEPTMSSTSDASMSCTLGSGVATTDPSNSGDASTSGIKCL